MNESLVETSKFLSFILRHKPETIGLKLSDSGWVKIEDLIDAARKNGRMINKELIDEVVKTNDKQRFTYSSDGLYIRANQGHSIQIDLDLKAQVPPNILFHGTAEKFVDNIFKEGLLKMKRHHVHLHVSKDDARKVGERRGKPIILEIDSKSMYDDGLSFYLSKNGVWLTEYVSPQYIKKGL